MNLTEKIYLTSGDSVKEHCESITGFPMLKNTNGPNGLTRCGVQTAYPNMCLTACSFDKELMHKYAENIAYDCDKSGAKLMLAPSINIKRLPICGRNFEYISEDPCLTAELGIEYVNGLQENGVATCVKHFACYNQEVNRFSYNSVVRKDVFFDIYAKAFEMIIKKSNPITLMMSYNRFNGEFASENKFLIDTLRNRFGFNGLIVSDWGGIDDRAKSLKVGNNLDMPGSDGSTHGEIEKAVLDGYLTEEEVEYSANKVIDLVKWANSHKCKAKRDDRVSVEMIEKSAVLLKNEGVLPYKESDDIIIVGKFAKEPIIQGGGCAKVPCNPYISPYDYFSSKTKTKYYTEQEVLSGADLSCGKILYFAGINEPDSETYDREDISLPKEQIDAIKTIYKQNKNLAVLLTNGSAVELKEVAENSGAILDFFYPGEFYGEGAFNLVFGKVSPSGRLAETFPLKLSDVPSFKYYLNDKSQVLYEENHFVGYRYYASNDIKCMYPFGYGLSYTKFSWKNFSVNRNDSGLHIVLTVKNEGNCYGGDVVQVYLKNLTDISKPKMKLIGFSKVYLNKGEEKTVSFDIDYGYVKEFDMVKDDYVFPKYKSEVCIAKNAMEVEYSKTIEFGKKKIDRYTTVGELCKTEKGRELVSKILQPYLSMAAYGVLDVSIEFNKEGKIKGEKFFNEVAFNMPLRALVTLTAGKFSNQYLNELIEKWNKMNFFE